MKKRCDSVGEYFSRSMPVCEVERLSRSMSWSTVRGAASPRTSSCGCIRSRWLGHTVRIWSQAR